MIIYLIYSFCSGGLLIAFASVGFTDEDGISILDIN